jgi:GntR family transcriptional regulator, transcriptional repressor for pyruvate dehydrogenase complex
MTLLLRADEISSDQSELVETLRGMLAMGASLPAERALAGQLNVNRYRLRQALEVLRAGGEIEATPPRRRPGRARQGGEAMVRSTNPVEVIEMRLALEPALARLAALRASPFEITRIERAATTPAGADAGAADLTFHTLVAAGARNTLAGDFYALLRQVGRDARLRVGNNAPSCPTRLQQRDAEHRVIAQAIAARDPDQAEAAMREHLGTVQRTIMNRMAPGQRVA